MHSYYWFDIVWIAKVLGKNTTMEEIEVYRRCSPSGSLFYYEESWSSHWMLIITDIFWLHCNRTSRHILWVVHYERLWNSYVLLTPSTGSLHIQHTNYNGEPLESPDSSSKCKTREYPINEFRTYGMEDDGCNN